MTRNALELLLLEDANAFFDARAEETQGLSLIENAILSFLHADFLLLFALH